jgi:hypothetical protein
MIGASGHHFQDGLTDLSNGARTTISGDDFARHIQEAAGIREIANSLPYPLYGRINLDGADNASKHGRDDLLIRCCHAGTHFLVSGVGRCACCAGASEIYELSRLVRH